MEYAFGKGAALKRLRSSALRLVISIGALLFLYIVMGSFTGRCVPLNIFFYRFIPCEIFNNEIVIPLCEMIIVGGGLFAIFIALVLLSKTDKDSE